jgi:lysozyme
MPYIWDPGTLRARWVEDAPRPPKPAPAATTPKPTTPAKVLTKTLAALVGSAVAAALLVMVSNFEGTRLMGYLDPVGIPTKCMGDTTNVDVGYRYTEAECRASLDTQLLAHAAPVLACVPALQRRDNQLSASVSFAYNLGTGGVLQVHRSAALQRRRLAGRVPGLQRGRCRTGALGDGARRGAAGASEAPGGGSGSLLNGPGVTPTNE